MSRRAILQIGTEKTGTTTLQHFLAANRAALAERGFVYPRFCGALNHTGLAAFALDPAKQDPIREPFGVTGEAGEAAIAAMRSRLRQAAAAELTADPAGAATAIFCNEHCHSRLKTPREVATLRAFLREFFDDAQICIYLRRQDRVALSLYSTQLKSGGVERRILPRTHPGDPYFNYDRSLAIWEDVFGAENMHVRLFDRQTLTGGSIVSDFADLWSLGDIGGFTAVADQNGAIEPIAQEFLRLVNPHLERIDGLPIEEVRGPLVSRLAQLAAGPGARPARAEAEAFYAPYRASNAAVCARYFPQRATLFDEDFSLYPEVADTREITLDEIAALAARLHAAQVRETRRLEAEIAIRDARLHWARDEPEAAERALGRALAWRPKNAEAWRVLAEFMLRLNRTSDAAEAARRAAEHRPDAYEYWHFLGVVLRRDRDLSGAVAAQRRALALNPSHAASRQEIEQLEAAEADLPHQAAARRA